MGKIFKALEKAEKKEIVKERDYSASNSNIAAKSSGMDQPKKRRPMRLSASQHAAADSIPKVTQVKPPAQRKAVEPLERNTFEENRPFDEKSIPLSQLAAYLGQYKEEGSDAVNLEVIRSGSDETIQEKIARINKTSPAKQDVESNKRGKEDRERKRVNVRYSKTKVQFNDPERLKNNRVLSIFDDIETANQFKILRTQVLRKLKSIGGNSILVTSSNPYEGKTFTSINLGLSISKEFDRTVLIIDADIRRPTKHHTDFSTEFFSLKVEKGLTDYLAGDADIEDIIINPGIEKITLIPGGVPVDNSPELLNSDRMENMMAEIKSRYPSDRLVIVDGPALLHYPDAMILYRYVDGVLPVVESERTSSEDLKKMMKQLKDVNVNLLGVVFNKNKG